MRNPHNIRLGQKVYTTNYIPLSKETIIKERTVVAIGRKYFYLDTIGGEPVRLEDLRYESPAYSQADFTVYLTQQ